MNNSTTAQLFRGIADELRASPNRWTQGCSARNAEGQPVGNIDPDSIYKPVCWCTIGLIYRDASTSAEATKACDLFQKTNGLHLFLGNWNDAEERTVEDVIAAFERAADLAEEIA